MGKFFHLRFLHISLVVLALFLSAFAMEIAPGFFQPLDHVLDDWRTRFSWHVPGKTQKESHQESQTESRVVIVDIDEKSLKEQGPWPWSREKMSQLISILMDEYGASGIALDIVFPEEKENDNKLVAQLQRPEITGAVVYDFIKRGQPELQESLPPLPNIQLTPDVPRILGLPVTSNHAALMPTRVGHITPMFDSDGSIRHLPPMACHPVRTNECRPLLGVAAFMGLLAEPGLRFQRGQGILSPAWEMVLSEASSVDIVKVPVNADGTLTVPYRHQKKDWTSISATQILKRQAKRDFFRGSLVLVGATALGMSDLVYTPVSPNASGLEPHAEVMVALMDNNFLVLPQYGKWISVLILLPLIGLLKWLMVKFESPEQRALIFPVWLIASWFYAFVCSMIFYVALNSLIPLTPLALFPIFAALLVVCSELYFATRERNGVSGLLAAYLPRQVAHKLTTANRSGVDMDTSVDASRRMITVMFADLRGFTGIAEGSKPEVVAKLMHKVFSEMAAAVVEHHGTIDKFIGDAVMAFWNAPDDDEQHALHALAAAQDMLRRIHTLEAYCQQLGVPPVKIGIGIESGYALVGNFGSEHRRTYTALGETVVLASRIEGLTAQYQCAILLGDTCAKMLDYAGLEALGNAHIRGRQRELALYTPVCVPADRTGMH